MALRQPNSATVWTLPRDSTAAQTITPVNLENDGSGRLVPTPNGAIDGRLLANAYSGFSVNEGGDNPSGLAEMRLLDVGTIIQPYE